MKSPALKTTRLVLAVLVFVIITLSFIDFRYIIPDKWFSFILYLQFVPSVLNFMNLPALATAGFIFVLGLTLVTGRSYCSILCPLGIYQDIVSRAGGKFRRKFRKFRYGKPYVILRHLILAVTLIVMLAGSVFLISLLDPYSVFGRFATYFFQPVVLLLNNLIAAVTSLFDNYFIFKVDFIKIPLAVYILPVLLLVLVTLLSFTKGRLYCNTVCPLGTLLGLISRVSFLRIRINESQCTHCGLCAVNCKASCIDFKNEDVDLSRCVTCFNCITACPDNAISYGYKRTGTVKNIDEPDQGKRGFIGGILLFLAFIPRIIKAQDAPVPKKESTVQEDRTSPVCPPGGVSIEHFNTYCTACSLCVSACPNNVIIPSFNEYGLSGLMQPRMDYHKGFCNFECIRCTEVCPSGALLPLALEAKKLTQIGKVNFIKENCIVETERTDCGACSEHCPTKAVQMVPYIGNLVIPEVNNEICVGCGACEYACPTKPFKAIFVDGNPIHQDAKKPDETELNVKELDEFPF
ncbi:MAG: 4Fe-4S dicluster domain-containing protein [Bacteroidales bacterium]|nr:4Fe-4S dicluster domain-containing protein [Bacteroidales bacterium]